MTFVLIGANSDIVLKFFNAKDLALVSFIAQLAFQVLPKMFIHELCTTIIF